MSPNKLASLALFVALAALGITLLSRPTTTPVSAWSAEPGPTPLDVDQRLATLADRLTAVEDAVFDLRLQAPAPLTDARQEAGETPDPTAGLGSRLAAIERRLTAAEAQGRAKDVAGSELAIALFRPRDERPPEEWIELARGSDATTEEMLSALRELRFDELEDGTDARLPVLNEMIALVHRSEDGDVRADVWRQMDGVVDPLLATALLDTLANDPYAQAREEAAESLAPFLPDAGVESALRAAAQYDEDEDVRAQASSSLRGGK